MTCRFCLIASGAANIEVITKNPLWLVFRDGDRFVVIPKKHETSLEHIDPIILGQMAKVGGQVARQHGMGPSGYQISLGVGRSNPDVEPEDREHLHLIVEAAK